MGGGLPYTVSGPWGHPESEQSRREQIHQEQSVSLLCLESLFKCPVGSFHHPRTLGLYAVCNFHLMFNVLLTCYTKPAMKARSLSDPVLVGNPNLGTTSLNMHRATFDAFLVHVGKASTHPEMGSR